MNENERIDIAAVVAERDRAREQRDELRQQRDRLNEENKQLRAKIAGMEAAAKFKEQFGAAFGRR